MMLVSPIPATTLFAPTDSPSSIQYQPAKNIDAFKSLLPPKIDFVQGSSTGALAIPEGKYEPVNIAKPTTASATPTLHKRVPITPVSSSPSKSTSSPAGAKTKSLHPEPIDDSWPTTCNLGSGLQNIGNTCFLNSALQCLLHTGPLLNLLIAHDKDQCRSKGFCMTCSLRQTMVESYKSGRKSSFVPSHITGKLQVIAKHMRRGRQEDSHEFLRYAVDALQKACLASYPQKIDPKLAETTWVHRLFGGQLRSRVTCERCGHNSETFDRILDLSLDISGVRSLNNALRAFIAIDHLKGADKYKCEKCKIPVSARKQFTIHEAPMILTIHLKRFSPLGKKISHPVHYDEHFTLRPAMSEGKFGPSYHLYGVICHTGSGPNSGHYYAHVKSRQGKWHMMNDEYVAPDSNAPLGLKSAYILFYLQESNQKADTLNGDTMASESPLNGQKNGIIAGMKKRKGIDEVEKEAEQGTKKRFIGPLFHSSTTEAIKQSRPSISDPQAAKLKKKLDILKSTGSLVGDYGSDSDNEKDKADKSGGESNSPLSSQSKTEASDELTPTTPKTEDASARVIGPVQTPTSSSPPPPLSSSPAPNVFPTASATNFYGSTSAKRKHSEGDRDQDRPNGSFSPLHSLIKSDSYAPHHHDAQREHRSPKHSMMSFTPQNGSTPNKHRKRHSRDSHSPRKSSSSFGAGNPFSSRLRSGGMKTYGKKGKFRGSKHFKS